MKRSLLVTLLLLAALPGLALALATEHHGNAPIGPQWNFPADVLGVANLKSRTYWREINGDPTFCFRGNTAALNKALDAFAKIGGEKEILLLPGPGDVRTLVERNPVPCDWELHAPSGLYAVTARREKGTEVMTKHPRLTIHVTFAAPPAPPDVKQVERWIADLDNDNFDRREKATKELEKLGRDAAPALRKALEGEPGAEKRRRIEQLLEKLDGIDLQLLRLPAGARLLTLESLRERYVKGLKSDDPTIRGMAATGLGELARYTDAVVPTLLETLKADRHEYVRRSAAGALSRLGKRGADALPVLKEGLKDADVNVRNAFQAAADRIENPKDDQPTPEQLKKWGTLLKEIREQANGR
ncbi:MAG: HEAT repeat domain-containing protein, partial [Gemmatimonadales bacterium]